jgi:formylglycine-generating enzyme required for sulfatase activity
MMNTHSQKLVHHLIASQVGNQEAPIEAATTFDQLGLDTLDRALVALRIEDVTGADGDLFIHALDHSRTVGDLVALVDRRWQRGKRGLVMSRVSAFPASLLVLAACAAPPSPAAHPVAIPGTSAIPGVADEMPPSVVAKPSPVGSMVRIHEASALMGSDTGEADERQVHEVHVSAFDMDLTEVTASQYESCVLAGACVAAGSTASWLGITTVDSQLSADECNRDRADRQDYAANWSGSTRRAVGTATSPSTARPSCR